MEQLQLVHLKGSQMDSWRKLKPDAYYVSFGFWELKAKTKNRFYRSKISRCQVSFEFSFGRMQLVIPVIIEFEYPEKLSLTSFSYYFEKLSETPISSIRQNLQKVLIKLA